MTKNIPFRINKTVITLFHYQIPENISNEKIQSLISSFSCTEQQYFNSIKHKDSRNQKLFGRIILYYIAGNLGLYKPDYLKFTDSGKPEFNSHSPYNFNISNSGNLVVCSLVKDAQIGIDLELIRPVNIEKYRDYFNLAEWQFITNSENPEIEFLKLWVRKEAVIKADGRGMEIELSSLNCLKSKVKTEAGTWFIHEVEISPDFLCAVACNKFKNIVLLNFDTVFEMEKSNFFKVNY